MHTVISDGTDTPETLLAKVREAGIDLFSATDHDAIKGSCIFPALLRKGDPAFLAGVEFSCRDGEGKYHILGYGYDPDAAPIRALVEKGHALRMKKAEARLAFLETEFGFSFPEEEVSRLLALDNPGKPHIGNLMVKYGYAETKERAIRQYIDQLHVQSEYVRPEDAIRGIRESGGIPVLAHPVYGSGDQLILGAELETRVRRLKTYGLAGLEGFYSGYTEKLRGEVLALAELCKLYVTAGSDYHGKNKLVEPGDTGLEADAAYPDGFRRFLEDVTIHASPAV